MCIRASCVIVVFLIVSVHFSAIEWREPKDRPNFCLRAALDALTDGVEVVLALVGIQRFGRPSKTRQPAKRSEGTKRASGA